MTACSLIPTPRSLAMKEHTECFERGQQDYDVRRESVREVLSEKVALGDLKDEKEGASHAER